MKRSTLCFLLALLCYVLGAVTASLSLNTIAFGCMVAGILYTLVGQSLAERKSLVGWRLDTGIAIQNSNWLCVVDVGANDGEPVWILPAEGERMKGDKAVLAPGASRTFRYEQGRWV